MSYCVLDHCPHANLVCTRLGPCGFGEPHRKEGPGLQGLPCGRGEGGTGWVPEGGLPSTSSNGKESLRGPSVGGGACDGSRQVRGRYDGWGSLPPSSCHSAGPQLHTFAFCPGASTGGVGGIGGEAKDGGCPSLTPAPAWGGLACPTPTTLPSAGAGTACSAWTTLSRHLGSGHLPNLCLAWHSQTALCPRPGVLAGFEAGGLPDVRMIGRIIVPGQAGPKGQLIPPVLLPPFPFLPRHGVFP